MSDTVETSTWHDWCQLIRLPNVFTVVADTTAAFLLVAGSFQPLSHYIVVLASVVLLYWAGMILNDVWDVEVDRAERSSRPLASGRITVSSASKVGWSCLSIGVAFAFTISWFDGGSLVCGVIALLLAIMIVLYDGPLKKLPVAPIAMGACRFLSFLLGASAAASGLFAQPHVMAIAAGFGVYIVGVTIMARGEATGENRSRLVFGLIVTLVGLVLIALAPRVAADNMDFKFDPLKGFAILIGLLACTVLHRSLRAISRPEPQLIQANIKHAILTLIPLSASVALLGAGQIPALIVLALVLPAMFLGSILRMT